MIRVCAACSVISVLTQWGATLVIKLGERERLRLSVSKTRVSRSRVDWAIEAAPPRCLLMEIRHFLEGAEVALAQKMSNVDEKVAVELQGSPETKRNLSQLVPVTFEAVRYTVKVKKAEKVILDGISGVMPAGRMTALMGPSGSGKTTLLDVLAGRKTSGAIEGEVLFAGQKLARGALRNLTGYVEQFDTLIGELSVKQMLMYTAELKLTPATSRADKEVRVQRVITKLGLEGCADTTIGNVLQRGISGGQAKRVNIALALITQPRVLFLDEPTSGLDSHMANEVVQSLHALLAEGRTIVCTIHSPTSKAFALFDDLLVLKEGKLAFGGP
jgi:ABC-type multidrug transport system ATPase subunit